MITKKFDYIVDDNFEYFQLVDDGDDVVHPADDGDDDDDYDDNVHPVDDGIDNDGSHKAQGEDDENPHLSHDYDHHDDQLPLLSFIIIMTVTLTMRTMIMRGTHT